MTLSPANGSARVPRDPTPTFLSHVGGRDVDSGRYLYTVRTRSILTDMFASLTRKRRLEQGLEDGPTDDVVGRCAVADPETVAAAVDAAADAAPVWAATPLATRMRLGAMVRAGINAHHGELVAVLVAEGSPAELIGRYSTREVLELRFPPGENTGHALADLADRVEVLPDRILLYTADGEAVLAAAHARGVRPLSSLVRRSTLEDVFLRLTGRTLVD